MVASVMACGDGASPSDTKTLTAHTPTPALFVSPTQTPAQTVTAGELTRPQSAGLQYHEDAPGAGEYSYEIVPNPNSEPGGRISGYIGTYDGKPRPIPGRLPG